VARHYAAIISIEAAPETVWPVMAHVVAWPDWTPSVKRVVALSPGAIGVGSRVRIHQPGLPPAIWRVTEWNPGHQFTWESEAPGIWVTAVHRVERAGAGSRVTLTLDYAGPLGGVLAWLTHKFNTQYPELEAKGLKAHCESLAAGRTPTRPAPLPAIAGTKYLGIVWAWLALALLAGGSGLTTQMRPPVPQVILFGSTALVILSFWRAKQFRAWALNLPPRALVLPHLVRFVGFYFLVLHARGELPWAFAVPGGWGDIAVATLALGVMTINAETRWGKRAYFTWNILGLVDILFVVVTATRLVIADPDSISALLRLPLSLLPTFIVPLILATHIMLFVRLAHRKP
jgi:hypothetical protein